MKRIVKRRKFLEVRFKSEFGSKVQVKTEENKEPNGQFRITWDWANGYKVNEILDPNNRFIIKIQGSIGTYRIQDFIGNLFAHAMRVIRYRKDKIKP